jgi:omega-6 fatty acid desaturase (delta-12 desaturase)
MTTNVGIIAVLATLVTIVGLRLVLWIYVPTVLIAAAAGVWLFYVEHQFENTYWSHGSNWKPQDAALYGTSQYQLPAVVRWFMANIGIHHVHHLSSAIPFYRLPDVLRDHHELRDVGRVNLRQSFRGVQLVLWDEQKGALGIVRAAA